MKILPLIKLQPTENETEIPNRSWFPGRSHLQKQGKTERPVQSWFAIYKITVEGRVSWKFLVCHVQRQGRAERPENLGSPSTKTTEGRASWKIFVFYPQRLRKAERPGNS